MESNQTAALAAALLPNVEGSEAAATLMEIAEIRGNAPIRLQATIPGHTVLSRAKASIAVSTTAVRACDDPDALDKMSRDSRLGVRREVARNDHTRIDTIDRLYAWSLSHSDKEVLAATAPRATLSHALELLFECATGHWVKENYPVGTIARRIADEGSPHTVLEALGSRVQGIVSYLGLLSQTGKIVEPSLTAMYSALPGEARRTELLSGALRTSNTPVGSELAGLLIEHFDAGLSLEDSYRYGGRRDSVRTEADAAMMLASSGHEPLVEMAARSCGDLTDEVIETIIESGHLLARVLLITNHIDQLTGDRSERIVMAPDAINNPEALHKLFKAAPVELSTEARLRVLRSYGRVATIEWLAGDTSQPPRPGEVSKVVSDHAAWRQLPSHAVEDLSLSDIVKLTLSSSEKILAGDRADELVSELGSAWFSTMMSQLWSASPAVSYTAKRFESVFGSDGDLWNSALHFAPSWDGDLDGLIETVMIVNGRTPPSHPAVDEPVAECEGELVQLSLL